MSAWRCSVEEPGMWVVQQFSGLDVSIIYKAHTSISLVLGATAMTTVYIISLFVM